MCHGTFLLFLNIQEPSFERPSPSNIGLRQEDIIVIKNNIEGKKVTYLPQVEIVANVLHMYIVSSLTHILTLLEKRITYPEPLTDKRLTNWSW